MVEEKIKFVKLISANGEILNEPGFIDTNDIKDSNGNVCAVGFESDGTVHGTFGDLDTGQILFENGEDTGYNVNKNYISFVSLRIVHNVKEAA